MSRILWELVNLYMIINMYFIEEQIMHLSKSSLEFKNYFCPDTVLRDIEGCKWYLRKFSFPKMTFEWDNYVWFLNFV